MGDKDHIILAEELFGIDVNKRAKRPRSYLCEKKGTNDVRCQATDMALGSVGSHAFRSVAFVDFLARHGLIFVDIFSSNSVVRSYLTYIRKDRSRCTARRFGVRSRVANLYFVASGRHDS